MKMKESNVLKNIFAQSKKYAYNEAVDFFKKNKRYFHSVGYTPEKGFLKCARGFSIVGNGLEIIKGLKNEAEKYQCRIHCQNHQGTLICCPLHIYSDDGMKEAFADSRQNINIVFPVSTSTREQRAWLKTVNEFFRKAEGRPYFKAVHKFNSKSQKFELIRIDPVSKMKAPWGLKSKGAIELNKTKEEIRKMFDICKKEDRNITKVEFHRKYILPKYSGISCDNLKKKLRHM